MEVDPVLWGDWRATLTAREAHTTAVRAGDDDQAQITFDAAQEAANHLNRQLKLVNTNRNRIVGDRPTPRKLKASAPPAGTNAVDTAELQSIRRGILAGVEVGKLVRFTAFRLRIAC